MSRFYRIEIGAETATPIASTTNTPSNNAGAVWTNLVGGKVDLGAQTVEWDIPLVAFDAPMGQAWVRIWGPSKAQISQASDFSGAPISIFAGMQNGLPLATAAAGQAGLLLKGQIYQSYANWQGIVQTLEFVVTVDGGYTQSRPGNFTIDWKKGQRLADAVRQVLQTAFQGQGYTISVMISDRLVLTQDGPHTCETLQQFASYVKGVSQDILGGNYSGVSMTLHNNVVSVFDDTQTSSRGTVSINEQDLIGQVTWLDAYTIQFNTVMRSDLVVGTLVSLPTLAGLQAVTGQNSQSNARSQNAFQGNWTVSLVRHVGNSRAPDAQSWVSTFQAFSNQADPAVTSVANSSL